MESEERKRVFMSIVKAVGYLGAFICVAAVICFFVSVQNELIEGRLMALEHYSDAEAAAAEAHYRWRALKGNLVPLLIAIAVCLLLILKSIRHFRFLVKKAAAVFFRWVGKIPIRIRFVG